MTDGASIIFLLPTGGVFCDAYAVFTARVPFTETFLGSDLPRELSSDSETEGEI